MLSWTFDFGKEMGNMKMERNVFFCPFLLVPQDYKIKRKLFSLGLWPPFEGLATGDDENQYHRTVSTESFFVVMDLLFLYDERDLSAPQKASHNFAGVGFETFCMLKFLPNNPSGGSVTLHCFTCFKHEINFFIRFFFLPPKLWRPCTVTNQG